MGDAFKKVQSGDALRIPAETFNTFIDAARDFKARRQSSSRTPGFDVQQTIPWGTPEDVRREVRHLIDTYARPEGRFMLTAGNAVKGDCPTESLAALFDESFRYGASA